MNACIFTVSSSMLRNSKFYNYNYNNYNYIYALDNKVALCTQRAIIYTHLYTESNNSIINNDVFQNNKIIIIIIHPYIYIIIYI